MKVAIVNASARENGNSAHASAFIHQEILSRWPDAVVARVNLTQLNIHPCLGDAWCRRNDECLQDDDMRWIVKLLDDCDFVVFLSPVFFRDMCSTMKVFTDRCYPMIKGNPGDQKPKKSGKKAILIMFQYVKSRGFDDALKHTTWVLENLGFDVEDAFLFKDADDFGSAGDDEKNRQKIAKAIGSIGGRK
ncbi:MAG: flavodoxin family protein [Spirochaetales bacterium]|nr:flavodoxin family protein [Spirochaetales bacterium]